MCTPVVLLPHFISCSSCNSSVKDVALSLCVDKGTERGKEKSVALSSICFVLGAEGELFY
jgi:hypothetical protein